ncbi:MAG: CHAT domain-containing protein, partial [Theionarchaea archaeon]|nr:CHAT domain-containing protein [Theionarchaea archaeon]
EGLYTQAKSYFSEAFHIYRTLSEKYPEIYAPFVADSLVDLGILYNDINRPLKAKKAYYKALKIKKELEKEYPEVYTPQVALIYNNLGAFFSDRKKGSRAQKAYSEAFSRFTKASRWLDAAQTAYNLWTLTGEKNMLEYSRKILELAILLTQEEKYRYALKKRNESMYLHMLEDGERLLPFLETLRDAEYLSSASEIPREDLQRATHDTDFQKSLVESIMEKEDSVPECVLPDIPEDILFIYVQTLQEHILLYVLEQGNAHTYTCSKKFLELGEALKYSLAYQEMAVKHRHTFQFIQTFDELARRWWDVLPPDLQALLQEKDRIVFSPDPYCAPLPLEALHTSDGTLCLEKTVVRATSVHQFLSLFTRRCSFDSSLIIGNPWPDLHEEKLVYVPPSDSDKIVLSFLENAEREAHALTHVLPNPTPLLTQDATGERFLAEIQKNSLIHFAGHGNQGRILFLSGPFRGFAPPFEPEEFSALRKAERTDGTAPVSMMEEWHPVTDVDLIDVPVKEGAVIFLNACETGQLEYAGGGYFQGLAAVFLKNGAHSVVSSSIPLFDTHSKEFALHFYEKLLRTHSPVQALQQARNIMKETYTAHIFWIPYVQYGPPL